MEKNDWARLIGQKVDSVSATDGQANIQFTSSLEASIALYGDCCSHSYFTEPKQFQELVGATIQAVEERDGPEEDDGETRWSFLVFTTSKGHVTIDWRNDSNGYYAGWVELTVKGGTT